MFHLKTNSKTTSFNPISPIMTASFLYCPFLAKPLERAVYTLFSTPLLPFSLECTPVWGFYLNRSVRTFIVQVTNDPHVTKTNDQFSFFILISSININRQSGLLPSPWNILTLVGFQDYTGFSLTFPAVPFWFPFQILSHWPKINEK